MLVAHDGEWTRRRVPSVEWAHRFANQHSVPSYDAAVVGYPPRMREYNRRMKQTGLSAYAAAVASPASRRRSRLGRQTSVGGQLDEGRDGETGAAARTWPCGRGR